MADTRHLRQIPRRARPNAQDPEQVDPPLLRHRSRRAAGPGSGPVPRPVPRYGRPRYWSPLFPVAAETPSTPRCYHTRPSADDDPRCLNAPRPAPCHYSRSEVRHPSAPRWPCPSHGRPPVGRDPPMPGPVMHRDKPSATPPRARPCSAAPRRPAKPAAPPEPRSHAAPGTPPRSSRSLEQWRQPTTHNGARHAGGPLTGNPDGPMKVARTGSNRSHASGRRHSWLATHRVSGHRCVRS
jgi:hypothetical protein